MLVQMTERLDIGMDRRSIDIEQLDITSYLSAPNRINTWNKHVRAVYHIFTDSGWQEKLIAFCNLVSYG